MNSVVCIPVIYVINLRMCANIGCARVVYTNVVYGGSLPNSLIY